MGGPMQGAGELDGLAVARAVGPAEDKRSPQLKSSIFQKDITAALELQVTRRPGRGAAKPRRAWNFGSELG
eukprot:685334-Hanusia_phi.AAC.1